MDAKVYTECFGERCVAGTVQMALANAILETGRCTVERRLDMQWIHVSNAA
jgi:hypothetical protein